MTLRGTAVVVASLAAIGCGHGSPFDANTPALGPASAGSDVQLTFSADLDYWPEWTEDGRGILYAFVNPGPGAEHRCIGVLPAAGGTRVWQFCDDRANQRDSLNSLPAFALGDDGRLLYLEAETSVHNSSYAPERTTLWLADSASPFSRRALLSLPAFVGDVSVSWLADLAWTGPESFIGLAEQFSVYNQCATCPPRDTVLFGTGVVRGTTTESGASLQFVPGTSGASAYSLAENGASIVFTVRNDGRVFRIPATGGEPSVVAFISAPGGPPLLGVSCHDTECVVATDVVALTDTINTIPRVLSGPRRLWSVSLANGQISVLRESPDVISAPKLSPGGAVVAQVGAGMFGYLQTFGGGGNVDLHLFPAAVP